MATGIRAEVRINSPDGCPIAEIADSTGTPIHTISRSRTPDASNTVTEEFISEDDSMIPAESGLALTTAAERIQVDKVFSYGQKHVYRFNRAQNWGCPCECVEQFNCPIIESYTRDGALFLSFHAESIDALKAVLGALRAQHPHTSVQRLLQSNDEQTDSDLVFVDRSALTDRQTEVLETAHEMGYFDHPKGANAGQVADALDITTSTFTEHLSAAQRKLLAEILDS